MASRISDRLGRYAPPVILAFIGLFVLIAAYQKQQWDSDIFWALKSGELIVNSLSVPHADPFSYTFGGKPWVDFTWGFQALAYLAYAFLGWAGLSVLQAVLVSLTFVFLHVTLGALLPGRNWLRASILVAVYAAAHGRLFIRPHLFEFFFVTLFIMLLVLHDRREKPLYLFLLLPLETLWVNIHSSAILGFFIMGAYALGRLVDEARARGFSNFDLGRGVLMPALAALLAPVAALVNPYGPKLVIFPFIHHGVDNWDAIRHITEWVAPEFRELFFFFYPWPIEHFGFVVLFFTAAACLVLNARNTRSWAYMLFAGAVYMAVSHVRWVPLFSVFAAPVLAMGLRGVLERLEARAIFKGAVLSLAVFLTVILADKHMRPTGAFVPSMGVGLKHGTFPEGTVAYMKKEGLRGNLYNEYVYGGYLIHELPEVKVFIDGRTPTVYSSYFFWTSRLAEDYGRWKRLEEEHGIEMVLIKLGSSLCSKLREDKDWTAVSFDDVSILYLKQKNFPSQTSRAVGTINPCSSAAKFDMPGDRKTLEKGIAELQGLISSGNGSARARRMLGLAYTALGAEGYGRAAGELREAIAISEDAFTWYDLGVALNKDRKTAEALIAFEKAIELDENFREAWLALGAGHHDSGAHKEAIAALTEYLELADDKAEKLAYATLGDSYFQTAEFEKAVPYLKRAAFLTDDEKQLSEFYYKTGSSFFELGELDEGLVWYEKALSLNTEYTTVLRELAAGLELKGKKEAASRLMSLEALNKSPKVPSRRPSH